MDQQRRPLRRIVIRSRGSPVLRIRGPHRIVIRRGPPEPDAAPARPRVVRIQLRRGPPRHQPVIPNVGDPPASQRAISSLKIVRRVQDTCVVCLEDIHVCGAQLPCGHVFHYDCISLWLSKRCSCPTCRTMLESVDVEFNTQNSLVGIPEHLCSCELLHHVCSLDESVTRFQACPHGHFVHSSFPGCIDSCLVCELIANESSLLPDLEAGQTLSDNGEQGS